MTFGLEASTPPFKKWGGVHISFPMPHTGLGDGIFGLSPPHFFPDPISGTLILWDAVCEFMLCVCTQRSSVTVLFVSTFVVVGH